MKKEDINHKEESAPEQPSEDISSIEISDHALKQFMARSSFLDEGKARQSLKALLKNVIFINVKNNAIIFSSCNWTIITDQRQQIVITVY